MIWKQMSAWITMVGVGKIKEPILLHERIRSMGECVNAPWLMVCNSKEMAILFEKTRREEREVDFGDLWKVTHRHRDNTPTSEEEHIGQKQADLREFKVSVVVKTSSLRVGFKYKEEHSGRCCGMGFGARSIRVYGRSKGQPSSAKNVYCVN
ncbi:hypothetical protein K1719_027695 [Acacia pycnantha]|nr:hypothetical protein K1719_027695 [Acacia pycnantha]